jgi:RNA polymerase sigma-70 factor (ECF subfamily)
VSRQRSGASSISFSSDGHQEEAGLIALARNGDKAAVAELYRRHVDKIYQYIYARVRDAAAAEDLTAQVFLKALEALPSYEPGSTPFLGWLYCIAHARTVDHWRRQGRRQEMQLIETLASDDPWLDYLDAEGRWLTAMDLLAQLTDDQQDVMILRFMGDMSLSEVASILNKTVNAVKSIQHRALASLARLLQEAGR